MTTNDAAQSAIIELPRDMLDTIYEKYSEGENDARRAIATLKDRLRRKQKQLNWYKEEWSDLEDIRKMTVSLGDPWDGLAQDLGRVQERVRRATRELEALEQEYDRRQRERAIHFSPQKRKFLSIFRQNRQVHASQSCVEVDLEPTKTCPLCLDDDAEEIALCENLGGEDDNGERRGHGVCAACLPEYMEKGRDNCLVCRSPYGKTWREAKRKTYLPETFKLLAHQLTLLCGFEVTAHRVQLWYDWEEFIDEKRDRNRQKWQSDFLIEKRRIQNALDMAEDGYFDEQNKVKSSWLNKNWWLYYYKKCTVEELAEYLTQTCGYDVTVHEVRMWRIMKSKQVAANGRNFFSFLDNLKKRIRQSTPGENKKWWEASKFVLGLSKMSSSPAEDHRSNSTAQFAIMPTLQENLLAYGFSEEEALWIITKIDKSLWLNEDNTSDFEDEEFCFLLKESATDSLKSDMVLWGRFESFVDAYHRSAIAKLSADTVNAPLVNVVPSETCPLCLDDDAEEVALCENLGGEDENGERRGHGVCAACLPEYMEKGRDNCLVCRSPYGKTWQEAKRKTYLPETFKLMAHQLTLLCGFEVTTKRVKEWYDWEEFMDDRRDRHKQRWNSEFLIEKQRIQSAFDLDSGENEQVRSWWLNQNYLDYLMMKDNLKLLATSLTQTCGYDVTLNEVRLWRIVKSKDMEANASNFVSYIDNIKKKIRRASTPNEEEWVKNWWEASREEYLSKMSSSTVEDHDSSSIAQGLENEFTIMPTFQANLVTYGFSEEVASWIISNMKSTWTFYPDDDYTDDFEDEEFCFLTKESARKSFPWWAFIRLEQFQSFVDDYHRAAIAKLAAVSRPVSISQSATCPLCLDDDADEIALCENLGDFVNAEGERQGHGVCNTCLPAYLATGRDNCLICRTPYGDRWQTARQNHLPESGFAGPLDAEPEDPWIREMLDHMAQNSDDSDVSLPYDDDSSSSDEDGPRYGSRPTTRIPVFRRRQAPELFREAFAGAYTQEDNGGFDLIEDRDNVRQFPDPLEIGSSVWASENSIYTELSRHIPDHARLPSNERYIGLGWVVNAWHEGVEAGEDLSTWWYTIEWDLSWVSATQPVYIRTDHPRAHVQVEQPRSFARDWVREVPSFHIDVEFKVDGFTPAFDVLSGMRRWEPIYCRVIRKMPILGNTNQLVALSQEDGTFIKYKLVRAIEIFRGCELEHFQFKPHVWPSA